MAEQDAAERTEEPTPKRLEDSRRKGEVAQSRDVASVVLLFAAWLALTVFAARSIGLGMAQQATAAWSGAQIHPESLADFHALILHHGAAAARGFLPFALALMLIGTAVGAAQTGLLWSAEALSFKGSRIDPIQGMKRLLSPDKLFDLAKAPLKVGVVVGAVWLALDTHLPALLSLVGAPPASGLEVTYDIGFSVLRAALIGLGLLAAADYAWVRHRHRKRLRMSLREVREELREREGSPQVRGKRRQLQREMSRQRMIADVATADVVITNPTHYAIALRYVRAEMNAPKVVARGRNHLAERIRQAARRHGVPIVENPPLARLLYPATRVGKEVPTHLFQAVAEVLAYVYRLDRARASAWEAES
ncbi:MAG: flagellar biosynthesis protein FlhB [Myxococcota bacterium]|nr:flagellar biosynthesis protein FlhB [Myxococcota bacterium]